jgi:hypothetical protein
MGNLQIDQQASDQVSWALFSRQPEKTSVRRPVRANCGRGGVRSRGVTVQVGRGAGGGGLANLLQSPTPPKSRRPPYGALAKPGGQASRAGDGNLTELPADVKEISPILPPSTTVFVALFAAYFCKKAAASRSNPEAICRRNGAAMHQSHAAPRSWNALCGKPPAVTDRGLKCGTAIHYVETSQQ